MKVDVLTDARADGRTEVLVVLPPRESLMLMLAGRLERVVGQTVVALELEGTPADDHAELMRAADRARPADAADEECDLEELEPGYEARWHHHHVATNRYVHACADCRRTRRRAELTAGTR